MALSDDAKILLKTAVEFGGYGVYADNIVAAAELLTLNYARAEDDYDGPRLYPTDAGKQALTDEQEPQS